LGINASDEDACRGIAGVFERLFGFGPREGGTSIFLGECIEITKSPYLGTKGHIAIRCHQVERAVSYFASMGIASRPETAKRDRGLLKSIYLDLELGGFALHLMRA
jgi:2-dehydro-3-deoxyphosphogluconate aldolase / (4S)-4-hydroxy-2-oxoglutarate aldolase